MKYVLILMLLGLVIQPSSNLFAQDDSRTEALVIKLSAEKFKYMNPGKLNELKAILDDRVVFIHSNGMTETKNEMIQNLKDGKWKLNGVDVKEVSARIYKNNTAIVVGKGTFHVVSAGKELDMDLYYTEIWTHVKKGWLLASRHALKIV